MIEGVGKSKLREDKGEEKDRKGEGGKDKGEDGEVDGDRQKATEAQILLPAF